MIVHDNGEIKNTDINNINNLSYDIVAHADMLVSIGAAASVVKYDIRSLSEMALEVRKFAPYLEVYPDSHHLLFLTNAAIEMRRYFKDVFGVEYFISLKPPSMHWPMTVSEQDDYVRFDALFFLVKMSRAMGQSFSQFQGHMKVLSDDIKRLYGTVMNTEPYMFLRNRRDYVICFAENLDVLEVQAEWTCECEPVVPLADPVAVLDIVSPAYIQFDPLKGKDNKHGQMKLLTVEMRLLQYVSMSKRKFDGVMYLGSSPGDHISVLMKAYPNVRWYAFDLKPMIPWPNLEIIPNDSLKFGRLAPMFSEPRKRLVVINDIYISNISELYKVSDGYYEEILKHADIVCYMEKCFGYYKKPLLRVRQGAEIWCQGYQAAASGEMRQIFFERNGLHSINEGAYNNRETMFRQEIRPNVYVKGKCYDCHYTDMVLKGMEAVTGVNVASETRMLCARKHYVPKIWQALRKLKTKARIKKFSEDGVALGKTVHKYHYTERDDAEYSTFVMGKDVVRISSHIPDHQKLLADPDPPDITRAEGCILLVNDEFLIKVPPYEVFPDETLEVNINGRYEKERLFVNPFCINCNLQGVAFGPRLDYLGKLELNCGCTFVKTGVVRKEFFHIEPPDENVIFHSM